MDNRSNIIRPSRCGEIYFSSKTMYHTSTKVKETLAKRKMDFCLDKSSGFSGNETDNKDADFEPDPSPKRRKMVCEESLQNPSKVE